MIRTQPVISRGLQQLQQLAVAVTPLPTPMTIDPLTPPPHQSGVATLRNPTVSFFSLRLLAPHYFTRIISFSYDPFFHIRDGAASLSILICFFLSIAKILSQASFRSAVVVTRGLFIDALTSTYIKKKYIYECNYSLFVFRLPEPRRRVWETGLW